MEPVFGNEPIETSDGQPIDVRDYRHAFNVRNAKGRGFFRVYFTEPRSVLKSGKGKPQSSMWFNFGTGLCGKPNAHRYISLRNVTDPADFEFDI